MFGGRKPQDLGNFAVIRSLKRGQEGAFLLKKLHHSSALGETFRPSPHKKGKEREPNSLGVWRFIKVEFSASAGP